MKTFSTVLVVLSIVVAVMGVSAGFGVRMEWWEFPIAFTLLKSAFFAALICAALSLVVFTLVVIKRLPIKGLAFLALLVSVSVAVVPYLAKTEFRKIPTYGEAATDFKSLPAFDILAQEPRASAHKPPSFSLEEAQAAQEKYFPSIEPLRLKQDPEIVRKEVIQILGEMGLSLAPSGENDFLVEATKTSFWFGFKDDVVVEIRALKDGGSQVDIRSSSRVGRFDGGVNAKRIVAILAALQQREESLNTG